MLNWLPNMATFSNFWWHKPMALWCPMALWLYVAALPPWGRQVPSSEPADRKQMAFPIWVAAVDSNVGWFGLFHQPIRINISKSLGNNCCIDCSMMVNHGKRLFLSKHNNQKSIHQLPHIGGVSTLALRMANRLALLVLIHCHLRSHRFLSASPHVGF